MSAMCGCGAELNSNQCRQRSHATIGGPQRDYGLEAQHAAEAHLAACWEALDAEEGEAVDAEWPETAGPFCGCETCVVREVLQIAWPIFYEAGKAAS